VRKQPRQSPLSPSTTQTFTQGVAIGRGGGKGLLRNGKIKFQQYSKVTV
jgi:hypothetical protein